MHLNPYRAFNGQCEAAFKFYEQCLGGRIEMMMPHAGTPAEDHVLWHPVDDQLRQACLEPLRFRFRISCPGGQP